MALSNLRFIPLHTTRSLQNVTHWVLTKYFLTLASHLTKVRYLKPFLLHKQHVNRHVSMTSNDPPSLRIGGNATGRSSKLRASIRHAVLHKFEGVGWFMESQRIMHVIQVTWPASPLSVSQDTLTVTATRNYFFGSAFSEATPSRLTHNPTVNNTLALTTLVIKTFVGVPLVKEDN